ncbi:MAG: chemotaxis protein CheA [Planctomycetota bacterium]|nr:MAG: chemotaxis protein CheA [Planctomycetota bacterium]
MSDFQATIDALKKAIETPLAANDLGRLAQMHTACQQLMEGGGESAVLAAAVANLLEGIILNEAADASAGLAAIPDAIGILAAHVAGEQVACEETLARIRAAVSGQGGATTPAASEPSSEPSDDAGSSSASTAAAQEQPTDSEKSESQDAPSSDSAEPSTGDSGGSVGDVAPNLTGAECDDTAEVGEPAATEGAVESEVEQTPSSPEPAAESQLDQPAASAEAVESPSGESAPDSDDVEHYVSEPLVIDLDESEHLLGFVDEAREHMDAIETGLLEVERNPQNTDVINELFRPFHTIKGIAGFLNLRDINRLTHEVETILDLGRKSELEITPAIVDLFFNSIDFLKEQIESLAEYLAAPTGGPVPQPDITAIMRKLRRAAAGKPFDDGAATPPPAAPAAAKPAAESDAAPAPSSTPADAQISTATNAVQSAEPASAASAPPAATSAGGGGESGSRHAADTSIRVDVQRLDALVDAVGELVIAQTMVNLNSVVRSDEKLNRDVNQVSKIVRDIQETAMAMRMVPIGQTFGKMKRLVRDVSRKANKDVELIINGEETELDRNVIQAISDPLVHMVRNAVDHGVEPTEERLRLGKPPKGRVMLDAYHQGDTITIEISDDGRGLDRDKLIAKAIERGIVSPDDQLTDQQAFALIFAPGFSTAAVVTDISGRGVGMDVVKRNIEALRGKIEIQSELGKGSKFLIRLPLTLAIIDGMLVRVGQERLIIPTISIEQSLRPERKHINTVQGRGEMLQVRGELCPLIQMGRLLGFSPPIDPCSALVVITQYEGGKMGLVVDELIGQQQVVIKTLGESFKHVRGISGAAILGDGRVGLIVEPTGIMARYNQIDQGSSAEGAAAAPKTSDESAAIAEPSGVSS